MMEFEKMAKSHFMVIKLGRMGINISDITRTVASMEKELTQRSMGQLIREIGN